MFNQDFYPTKKETGQTMLAPMEIEEKIYFEPSAGRGDLVDLLKEYGAAEVLTCEIDPSLAEIVKLKSRFLGPDFLEITSEEISHIHGIVMNPPFSKDVEHILHAWRIAPDGCEITALCNAQSLQNTYSGKRRELKVLIRDHGNSTDIGDAFSDADRKTNVDVAMIRLYKPKTGEDADWSEYFDLDEEFEAQGDGLIQYNEVREIVNRYVGAVKLYDKVVEVGVQMNSMLGGFFGSDLTFTCTSEENGEISKQTFQKELQKSAWKWVFKKMDMKKYMTKSLKEDINKFVEQQTQIPFTMNNVYKMLRLVAGTHSQRMDKVLVEVFERFTQHYKDNRYNIEGWKSNSHYMLNKKMVLPWMTELGGSGQMNIKYNGNGELIDDLIKGLCYMVGKSYDNCTDLRSWVNYTVVTDPEWYRNNERIRNQAKGSYKHYSEKWDTKERFLKQWPSEEDYVQKEIERAIEEKRHYMTREWGK